MKQSKQNEVRILPQLDQAGGLDLHKDKIVLFISDSKGEKQFSQEYGTFTKDLNQIRDDLIMNNTKHCVMESTGIYWLSLFSILTESGIDVTVCNPMQVKQIPKRKTDKKDAKWLCTLLLHGLVKKSFIPESTQSELRDYCRLRLQYTQSNSKLLNRLVKILEINNIKLRSVLSNIKTRTGMDIIRLLSQGERDINVLLECLRGRAKKNKDRFKLALEGTLKDHHCSILKMILSDIEHNERNIVQLSETIDKIISVHYADVVDRLDRVSGIASQSAQIIVSEIGDDMNRFPTADHLTAWCGVAPGNSESAGKRKNTSTKKGNKYLRLAMVAVAWAAVKTKESYWGMLFRHLVKRMKPQKAIIVIARRLLKVVYRVIKENILYIEKGVALFFELSQRNRDAAYTSK